MSDPGDRDLVVTLASSRRELQAAQSLRKLVFRAAGRHRRRDDHDRFDDACDHLVVLDRTEPRHTPAVVGTYRLLRRSPATICGGFYSETMFDLSPLLAQPGELLEIGRSCVDPAFRDGRVIALLWQGIAAYARAHGVAWLFGCVSLPGTDPDDLADVLTWLDAEHAAPVERRPRALAQRRVEMRRKPVAEIDRARLRQALPPLLKGYLRLGGEIGDGAVVDHDLGTVPVCLVLEHAKIARRYSEHFSRTGTSDSGIVQERPPEQPPRAPAHRERTLEPA